MTYFWFLKMILSASSFLANVLLYGYSDQKGFSRDESPVIYKGSYMSVHVLLNLLNELRKIDKMRGFPNVRFIQ